MALALLLLIRRKPSNFDKPFEQFCLQYLSSFYSQIFVQIASIVLSGMGIEIPGGVRDGENVATVSTYEGEGYGLR